MTSPGRLATGLAVAAALLTAACSDPLPTDPGRPHWKRPDGGSFSEADLRRDHAACLAEHGRPDPRDGNEMARWMRVFGQCMANRGWAEDLPPT